MVLPSKLMQLRLLHRALSIMTKVRCAESEINWLEFQLYLSLTSLTNSGPARDYLSRRSWPAGVQSALLRGIQATPARFIICDDSGSMMSSDGKRLVGEGATSK
jgi:hypothetical protein